MTGHVPGDPATGLPDLPAGTVLVLDLAAANRDPAAFADPDTFDTCRTDLDRVLTFGVGLRPCPGRDHALALAVGVVDAVLGCRVIDAAPAGPETNPRVPARVMMVAR